MVGMTEEVAVPNPVRVVDDVDTLKALSDPLRLAILRVLTEGAQERSRTWSVKELAERLGQPQTKLYHHVRQLEARGLIEVAQTRLVSGITEQRYRSCQQVLRLDPGLLGGPESTEGTADVLRASLDYFRDEYLAAIRAGQVNFATDPPPEASYRRSIGVMASNEIPAARAAEFRDRLAALVAEFDAIPHDDDGVPVRFLTAFYSPSAAQSEPADDRTDD